MTPEEALLLLMGDWEAAHGNYGTAALYYLMDYMSAGGFFARGSLMQMLNKLDSPLSGNLLTLLDQITARYGFLNKSESEAIEVMDLINNRLSKNTQHDSKDSA